MSSTAEATDDTTAQPSRQKDDQKPLPEDVNKEPQKGKRPMCSRCDRPTRVCICKGLPASPIALQKCHILVLQHPHEAKRRNRSLPLVQLCLDDSSMTVAVSRRFGDQIDPKIVTMLQETPKVLLVFPAQEDEDIVDHPCNQCTLTLSQAKEFCQQPPPPPSSSPPSSSQQQDNHNHKILLVVLDATWKYAREMDKANLQTGQYPPHLKRVALSWDDPLRPSPAIVPCRFDIRTPPSQVHLSTAECIAWLLTALEEEDNNVESSIIYTVIVKALDEMVAQWHLCRQTATENHSTRKKKKKNKRGRNTDQPDEGEEKQEERDYSYYGNPDHANATNNNKKEEEEEDENPQVVSRTAFFTMGDDERGGKHHNNKHSRKKRRKN